MRYLVTVLRSVISDNAAESPVFMKYSSHMNSACFKIILNSNTIVIINKNKIGGIVPDG